jgi:MraZ protein
MLFAEDEWERLARKILSRPLSIYEVRKFRRRVFSNATWQHIDEGNRILVPRSLRDFAQLEDDVVLSGMYDFLEIWSPEIWRGVNDPVGGEINGSAWEVIGI